MEQTLYIISDLHLGGSPEEAEKPSFQMSDQKGRERLAAFIRSLIKKHTPQRAVHLVINGDFIDFLAEEPFQPFTISESEAMVKLDNAIKHSQNVFDALGEYCESGARLTILLGNHDIELSLPSVRRKMMDCLRHGNVHFFYDNEAFQIGPVLIEHGNRYDSWNAIHHNALRAVRSALSRKEDPPSFPIAPGSLLVEHVMNKIKVDYPFIDLLKPETYAAIPILAILAPEMFGELNEIGRWHKNYQLLFGATWAHVTSNREGRRLGGGYISAPRASGVPPKQKAHSRDMAAPLHGRSWVAAGPDDDTEAALTLARRLMRAGTTRTAEIASPLKALGKAAHTGRMAVNIKLAGNRIEAVSSLLEAWRYFCKNDPNYLDINHESNSYFRSINALWKKHEVVIYGHTHLAKYLKPEHRVYINTGTWADLIFVPRSVSENVEHQAFIDLYSFLDDLESNRLKHWRSQIPTYAKVEIGAGGRWEAHLCIFRGDRPDMAMESGSLIDWQAISRDGETA